MTLTTHGFVAALCWLRATQPNHGGWAAIELRETFPLLDAPTAAAAVNAWSAEAGVPATGHTWTRRPYDPQDPDGRGNPYPDLRRPKALPGVPLSEQPGYQAALHTLRDAPPSCGHEAASWLASIFPHLDPDIRAAAVAAYVVEARIPEGARDGPSRPRQPDRAVGLTPRESTTRE